MNSKSASSNRNAVLDLLDRMTDPMLVFNVAGLVVFANEAAKAMPGNLPNLLSGHPQVKDLVRDVVLGKATLPHEMTVELPNGDATRKLKCECVPGPAGVDLAMLLPRSREATVAVAADDSNDLLSLRQTMELLRSELTPPIRDFMAQLTDLQPARTQVMEAAHALTNRLARIVDLVNVFGNDVLIEDERIIVTELVQSICADLRPLLERNKTTIVFQGNVTDLPPIYGSRNLISRALREVFENAVVHSRREVAASQPLAIEVRYSFSGAHLLIAVRNLGAMSTVTLGRKPFVSALKPETTGEGSGSKEHGLRIGLPLAHRILQLHGGHVRIEQEGQSELAVLLELPTGAPQRNTQNLDMLQAQAYAEDLSRLISTTRARRS